MLVLLHLNVSGLSRCGDNDDDNDQQDDDDDNDDHDDDDDNDDEDGNDDGIHKELRIYEIKLYKLNT